MRVSSVEQGHKLYNLHLNSMKSTINLIFLPEPGMSRLTGAVNTTQNFCKLPAFEFNL